MTSELPKIAVAETLAHKIAAVKAGGLPADTTSKCEDLLIDVVGLCVTARNEDYVQSALAACDDDGPCTAIGHKRALSASGAAFVNGIAAMSASGNYGPCRVAEAIIGHADLTIGARVREVLEAELRVGGGRFRGIRHGVSWDPNDAIQKFATRSVPPHLVRDAKFREGFAQLAPLGLSFESWQYHPQLPDAIDLARAFPNTTIILNHVGGVLGVGPYAGHRQEILAGWKKDIAELAKCPNVNVKLGGVGMTSFGFDFHERDLPPSSEDLAAAWCRYIEPCIEAFGVNRCMFESNFPPDKQSGGYTELWNAFKRITSGHVGR